MLDICYEPNLSPNFPSRAALVVKKDMVDENLDEILCAVKTQRIVDATRPSSLDVIDLLLSSAIVLGATVCPRA